MALPSSPESPKTTFYAKAEYFLPTSSGTVSVHDNNDATYALCGFIHTADQQCELKSVNFSMENVATVNETDTVDIFLVKLSATQQIRTISGGVTFSGTSGQSDSAISGGATQVARLQITAAASAISTNVWPFVLTSADPEDLILANGERHAIIFRKASAVANIIAPVAVARYVQNP